MLCGNLNFSFRKLWGPKVRNLNKASEEQLQRNELSSESTPWDPWELDPKFFAALSRWTLDHPRNSLDRVLEDICIGIDRGKDILELIPNSPFPASSLISGLAHLVKLGAMVSKARADVQRLAKEVVHWVSEVRAAFEHGDGGHFSYKTLKHLQEMRVLIDAICQWATARLDDGRWSRIGHGMSIAKEIDEFKTRMAGARAIFLDLSMIDIAHAQDSIFGSVRDLTMSIQKAHAEQLSSILDKLEEQKKAEDRRQFLSRILSTRAVSNTAYDEQGKRPCDSDTRIDILADIKQWVYDTSTGGQSFLWLTGDPGSGKSAITASIARECKDDGILWAQFFINRNIGSTTNPASYFPSIARQLADHSSDVALALHDALREQPSLMDDISQLQAGKLFVESLKIASSTVPSKPVVVIIDGLDETDPLRLRYTAEVFSRALVDLPTNAKVFISSRTEDDIRRPFSATFEVKRVKHIHLDTFSESSIQDVSAFLVRKITEIVDQNGLDWLQWPGEDRIRGLCKQASGLFIWAVTTVKFIQDQVDTWGSECLNDVLDELSSKGMGDINTLYGTILRITHRDQIDPWIFERFRRVVGCIVVLQEPLCIADIKALLDLRKTASSVPVDIEHYIRKLRTVLVAGADAIDGQTVPRLHKSFFEFVTSSRVDPRFYVDMDKSNGEVALRCLHQLATLSDRRDASPSKQPLSRLPGSHPKHSTKALVSLVKTEIGHSYFPAPVRYALQFLTSHLPSAGRTTSGVAIAGSQKLPELPELQLLQMISRNDTRPSSFGLAFLSDRKQIISTLGNTISLWDAGSRANIESPVKISSIAILRSIALSPDGMTIAAGFQDGRISLWNAQTGQLIGEPFKGHIDVVQSVAFSPDSRLVVSGSWDKTICVWDARNCKPVGERLEGHIGTMRSVAFSPDGTCIASGSSDDSLRLWDARSGQSAGKPFKGHSGTVQSVAFSPDGTLAVSGSWDHIVRLWDAQSGETVGNPFVGHTNLVSSLAFSPDGKLLVSGSWDKTARIWNVRTGEPVGEPCRRHTDIIQAVAFSPNGKLVVSGSKDDTLCFWDALNGLPAGEPIKVYLGTVQSVSFLPDGSQVASASQDGAVRFWDIASGKLVKFPIEGHTDKVTCITVSQDHRTIASASLDNTVRVWNARTGHPIGSPLKGDTTEIICLVFSPEGDQIAGASLLGNVSLWDVKNRQLLASYRKNHINRITSLTFSPNGRRLISFCMDGTTRTWVALSGKRVEQSPTSETPFLDTSKSLSYSMRDGWCRGEVDGALLRWLPVDSPHFGLWAYVDGKVVKSDGHGSSIVVDYERGLQEQGRLLGINL